MTILTYQVFKTVADQCSFQKAADLLGLTPSAVSHAISSMENELGFSVFTRGKKGISLTNSGESLLPYVNSVLNSNESLLQTVSEMKGLRQGKVKLGAFSSTCTNWVPEIIRSFREKYENISVEIYEGTYSDVTYWIKNGIVDIGFLSAPLSRDFHFEPLQEDRLLCVMPKGERAGYEAGSALRKEKPEGRPCIYDEGYIEAKEMKRYQFVSQREDTDADIQKYMRENSLKVESKYHVVDDLSTVKLVEAGFGICLMPELVMNDIPYDVDCFPVKPECARIIGIAALSPNLMAPAVRTMYEHIVKRYKNVQ